MLTVLVFIFFPLTIKAQEPVTLFFGGVQRRQASNLKEMYEWLHLGYTTTLDEKNSNWVIEIDGGTYDTNDWHDILWHGQYSTPNTGYTLTIRPALNDTVIIMGNNTVDRALKIGSLTDGLIIENLIFDGFYRTQILVYQSKNCIIRNCTFRNMNREGAWTAISIQDCQGEWGNITVEGNTFSNLDSPGIGLHAVYLTRSDNNLIANNEIYYTSGGVFKCVDGSDQNLFDGNTIFDGCGDHAYFIGRNGTGQTILSRGNVVTNTQCLVSEGYQASNVYDNLAYRYVRKFVYTRTCCPFPEYEWPDDHQALYDSTQVFYIPSGHTGNNFNQIRSDFEVDIDHIIDENPAYIYLESNPAGSADNALYRGKFEADEDSNLIIEPDYYYTYHQEFKYLRKISINDHSKRPRRFTIPFILRTCEGEAIYQGDLESSNGVLELEKWHIETADSNQWIIDIEGAGQLINITNPDSLLMDLYTMEGTHKTSGNTIDFELLDETRYKLYIHGESTVTLKPTLSLTPVLQPEAEIPPTIVLEQNYPNPFNPRTLLRYTIPEQSITSLIVYDISGRTIQTIVSTSHNTGSYEVSWDGTDQAGQQVPGGMYFARLQAGEHSSVVKMVYLR